MAQAGDKGLGRLDQDNFPGTFTRKVTNNRGRSTGFTITVGNASIAIPRGDYQVETPGLASPCSHNHYSSN